MNYEDSVKYIHSLLKFGMNLGLERISALLNELGNPQEKLEFVHVAGTNGKGTTSTMLSSILCAAGKKTGLFTSPYVFDFCERIQINNKNIPQNTNPRAKIQVADPICLEARLCRPCDCCDCLGDSCIPVPSCVKCAFGDEFPDDFGHRPVEKAVAVTIGIFTIVQLERDVQMLIPAYDFCIPDKECSCDTDDPCEAFRKIQFPVDEFFPPNETKLQTGVSTATCCGCERSE